MQTKINSIPFKLIILFILLIRFEANGQDAIGAANSNYCPTNSVVINPSSMANSKTFLDINLVGVGAFVNNNVAFFGDNSILNTIRGNYKTELLADARKPVGHFYNRNFIAGPGGTWNKGDHSIGLAFNVRSHSSGIDIPPFVAPYIVNGVKFYTAQQNKDYSAQNIRIGSAHFAELKLSYANTFYKKGKDMITGGISFKKFYTMGGGAANIYDLSFNVRDSNTVSIYHMEGDFMNTPDFTILSGKGGMGLDLGVTYAKMLGQCSGYFPHSKGNGCRYVPYQYKIGLSIIDIGSIKFKEDSYKFAGYDISNFDWENYSDADTIKENHIDLFANQEEDITSGRITKTQRIKLPTFISAQFDYNIWSSIFYVNATIIQSLPQSINKFAVHRPNSLSVTPRFESKLVDFSIPFSLYRYTSPQLGLSLRVGPITIGSDKFVNWFFNKDVYGGDIYFYAKIPIKYHPDCRKQLKSKSKKSLAKMLKSNTNCTY